MKSLLLFAGGFISGIGATLIFLIVAGLVIDGKEDARRHRFMR